MYSEDRQQESPKNPYAVENFPSRSFEWNPANATTDGSGKPSRPDSPLRTSTIPAEEVPKIRAVKIGLQFYYNGLYLLTLCWFLGTFVARRGFANLATLITFGTAFGLIMVLYGEIKCLSIPKRSKGYNYILFSVLFYALNIALFSCKLALPNARGLWMQLSGLQVLFGFIANILFLTFIIYLAEYLKNQHLFRTAMKTRQDIWRLIIYFFFVIFVFIVLVNQIGPNQIAALVLGVGILGFILLVYAWLQRFSRLVRETSRAIVIDDPVLAYSASD